MDKELLFNIINCALKGETLEDSFAEKIDDGLLNCIKEQALLPFLYPVFGYKKFEEYYLQAFAVQEQFNFVRKKVKEVLQTSGIGHIFLKGSVIKDLYPDETLRSSGDIDFLVRPKDIMKARESLIKAGFCLKETLEQEITFTYGGVLVELHNALFANETLGSKYFSDPFSHAVMQEDYTFTLEQNYNFLYIITHYAKHLMSGAGLRPLCDIYLMMNGYELDYAYIKDELKKLKLEEFFNTLLNMLDIVFDYKPLEFIKNEWAQKLLDYCIKSGIHGYGKEGDNLGNCISNNADGSRLKYLWKRQFIPIKYLFLRYPWTKSIILIPFGYVYRFFELLIKRRDLLGKAIKYKKKDDVFFDKIGLDF